MSDHSERRRHRRRNVNLFVSATKIDGVLGVTRDASPGGVYVTSERVTEVDDSFTLAFVWGDELCEVDAQVVRRDNQGVALELGELGPTAAWALGQALSS